LKKGCFVKIIIVLTVLIAVVLFLAQNYFDELILRPGEKLIKGFVFKGINREMRYVKETPEKDSLKVLMDNFVHNRLKNKKEISINGEEMKKLVDSVKIFFADSLITADELEKIKKLFESE
jgi:hypothetical protein